MGQRLMYRPVCEFGNLREMFGKTLVNVFASAFVFAFVCRLFASTSYPAHCLQTPPVCKRLFASFVCDALRATPSTCMTCTYPHQMGWRGFCTEPGGDDDDPAPFCALAKGASGASGISSGPEPNGSGDQEALLWRFSRVPRVAPVGSACRSPLDS